MYRTVQTSRRCSAILRIATSPGCSWALFAFADEWTTTRLKEVDLVLKRVSRAWLVVGIWSAALGALIATSVAMGARPSTSVVLFVIGAAPAVMMALNGARAASPTVAEILHSVNAGDGGPSDERR
jgi:hypothetical protein